MYPGHPGCRPGFASRGRLTYEYYPIDDILDIFLVNTQRIKDVIESTEDIDDDDHWSILATKDKHGCLIALQINEASKVPVDFE